MFLQNRKNAESFLKRNSPEMLKPFESMKGELFVFFRDKEIDGNDRETLLKDFNLLRGFGYKIENYVYQIDGKNLADSTMITFHLEGDEDNSFYICSNVDRIQSGEYRFKEHL